LNYKNTRTHVIESIQNSDARELPRRKHTTFRRQRITQKKAYKIQTPENYPEESIQNSDAR